MLVLTRKRNQAIIIGDDIRIEVVQVKGNQVRLGITAPADVRVLRGELPRFDSAEVEPPASRVDRATDHRGQSHVAEQITCYAT